MHAFPRQLNAIAAGLAMTVFESTMSSRHFKHALSKPLILGLGRALLVVLAVYGLLRLEDLLLITQDGCEVLADFPYGLAP